jgi:hypothetical protein
MILARRVRARLITAIVWCAVMLALCAAGAV